MMLIRAIFLFSFLLLGCDKIDPKTNCPVKNGASGYYVIIYDQSESYNVTAANDIKAKLKNLIKDIPPLYEVSFYSINDTLVSNITPEYCKCKPDTSGSELIKGKLYQKKVYETKFYNPLMEKIDGAINGKYSDYSPLMEAIQSIFINKVQEKSDQPFEIVLVSDLLQFSNRADLINSSVSFNEFKQTNSYRDLRTDFYQKNFKILFAQRRGQSLQQELILKNFWSHYIETLNGNLVQINTIQGLNSQGNL